MAERLIRARLEPGDRVVCLGDSITADPHGYVTMAQQVLCLSRPGLQVINAGAPGNTAADMASRFEADVLARKPSWVTISAGGNDVLRAVPVTEYASSLQVMMDVAQAAGTRVAVCTPTPVEPQLAGIPVDAVNALIAQYAAWLKRTVRQRGLLLIPMHEVFELVHEAADPADAVCLTHDGLHMSPAGRYLMGLTFLAAFGVSLDPDSN
jgi:lysophospholipase L1-like esterase